MRVLFIVIIFLSTSVVHAADIAYGEVIGIKRYDFSSSKVIKVYFAKDASNQATESCKGVGTITDGKHTDAVINQMLSIAMAGYLSGKKVRAYSEVSGSCEINLISLQSSYY